MKRTMFVMVVMVVLMGVSGVAAAYPRRTQAPSSEERAGGGYSYYGGYGYGYRDGWYNRGYYGGYYDGGYYGHPNTNVQVKYKERWDVRGGERSYEQSPKLEAKVIDAATLLGALLIIFH